MNEPAKRVTPPFRHLYASDPRPTYPVSRYRVPWISGDGFLAGLPVFLIEMDSASPKVPLDDLVSVVAKDRRKRGDRAPRWVAIIGDTQHADNELLVSLRALTRSLVCIETAGESSMCDYTGRLPLWDHVIVRAKPSLPKLSVEVFHSVVIAVKEDDQDLTPISAHLDKLAYNGPRFISGPASKKAVVKFGRDWRMTMPVVPDDAPVGVFADRIPPAGDDD